MSYSFPLEIRPRAAMELKAPYTSLHFVKKSGEKLFPGPQPRSSVRKG
jgi:hypothetical protein